MRVLFFSHLQDATGCPGLELVLASPVNGEQLWKILLDTFPALVNHKTSVRLARNWEYAVADTQFTDADEVALIPPVSGG